MNIVRHRAFARAGLIGNPTDGYGGKTIAFTIPEFVASVVIYPWERLEILWSREEQNRFDSIDELVNDVNQYGYYGGVRLVKATIKRFADYCRAQQKPLHAKCFSIRYETNIPRGVGLSGSSAIITATLKCLMEFYAVSIPQTVQPSLVRAVENDDLQIACGYQDRVVQTYEGLVYMDFSEMQTDQGYQFGVYEHLDERLLPPVYLAYDLAAAKTSASVHGPLRTRVEDNARLLDTMHRIAALVPPARLAIETRDADELHQLVDRNFDLRSELYAIQPHHLRMIAAARRVGASAKFAGSGGAIVGTCADDAMYAELVAHMHSESEHWRVIQPRIAPGHPGKT
ncbi:MAG: GHMP kinase [Planctomycetaceae bacterium]|nr:GHMP kinase [Planctomycetaceae bacterium]